MLIDHLIVSVLYKHFYEMKQRGRNVIPWFQTVVVLSFSIVIFCLLFALCILELMNKGKYEIKIAEVYFLAILMGFVIIIFVLIKKYYFNSNKFIDFLEELNSLPINKQKLYKVFVLITLIALPFLLLLVLYLFDSRK